jgi:hypothetical protein
VHGVVEGMSVKTRSLLIRHGELRSVPDWNPLIMPLCCVPVPGSKGRPRGIYTRTNKLVGNWITYEGDWPDRRTAEKVYQSWPDAPRLRCADEIIARAREIYCDWVEALIAVANWLDGCSVHFRLRRYVIDGIGALHEPWRS